jgi:hypothetical protein
MALDVFNRRKCVFIVDVSMYDLYASTQKKSDSLFQCFSLLLFFFNKFRNINFEAFNRILPSPKLRILNEQFYYRSLWREIFV